MVRLWRKLVLVRFLSRTQLSVSWYILSCARWAKWPPGFLSVLDLLDTQLVSVILPSVLLLDGHTGSSTPPPPRPLTGLPLTPPLRYIIVTPNQLTAASIVVSYWVDRDRINPGVFITIFLVAILIINYFGIKAFGEIEFWLSTFKVVTIIGLILLSLILALGGGPDKDRKGFRYWKSPGAFKPYEPYTGSTGYPPPPSLPPARIV